jgi:hypothetical protein
MRIDPDVIEASRPDDREIALLAAEVRRLQAVINSEEPTLTDEEQLAVYQGVASLLFEADRRETSDLAKPRLHMYAATLRALLERTK